MQRGRGRHGRKEARPGSTCRPPVLPTDLLLLDAPHVNQHHRGGEGAVLGFERSHPPHADAVAGWEDVNKLHMGTLVQPGLHDRSQ